MKVAKVRKMWQSTKEYRIDVYKRQEHTRPNLRILHPLPRVNEIAYDVDDNPKAYYFQQAQNGLYARRPLGGTVRLYALASLVILSRRIMTSLPCSTRRFARPSTISDTRL